MGDAHPEVGTLVVLTALDVEYRAVHAYLSDVEQRRDATGTHFAIGRLEGTSCRIALVEIGQGNVQAAALTQLAITSFQPRALFFVGIAGALKPDLCLGDVVVGTRIYPYHSGKEEGDVFHARPGALPAPHAFLQHAQALLRENTWAAPLASLPGQRVPKVHLAPIAAGEVVLNSADSALREKLRLMYQDAAAIEMESAGVAWAAHLNRLPALTIRGISDHADGSKQHTDKVGWQQTAACNAAAFAVHLMRNLPLANGIPQDSWAQELEDLADKLKEQERPAGRARHARAATTEQDLAREHELRAAADERIRLLLERVAEVEAKLAAAADLQATTTRELAASRRQMKAAGVYIKASDSELEQLRGRVNEQATEIGKLRRQAHRLLQENSHHVRELVPAEVPATAGPAIPVPAPAQPTPTPTPRNEPPAPPPLVVIEPPLLVVQPEQPADSFPADSSRRSRRRMLVAAAAAALTAVAIWGVPNLFSLLTQGPISFAGGSKPAADSTTDSTGTRHMALTWRVTPKQPVRAQFDVTHDDASKLPGNFTSTVPPDCQPNLTWTLAAEDYEVAEGTITTTSTYAINGRIPDDADSIDLIFTLSPDGRCAVTVTWHYSYW